MSKDYYTAETRLSIQTQMKLLQLAEKELDRLLDRNKTSGLKRYLNNMKVSLGTVQELKYKIKEIMVIHNEDMGKIGDEFSENLDGDVARFDDVLTNLDEAM